MIVYHLNILICNLTLLIHIHIIIKLKGVENKRVNAFKLIFLRYSTGESGMIVELFSHRPFMKILFCRITMWISRFRITEHFMKYRKFSRNLSENF